MRVHLTFCLVCAHFLRRQGPEGPGKSWPVELSKSTPAEEQLYKSREQLAARTQQCEWETGRMQEQVAAAQRAATSADAKVMQARTNLARLQMKQSRQDTNLARINETHASTTAQCEERAALQDAQREVTNRDMEGASNLVDSIECEKDSKSFLVCGHRVHAGTEQRHLVATLSSGAKEMLVQLGVHWTQEPEVADKCVSPKAARCENLADGVAGIRGRLRDRQHSLDLDREAHRTKCDAQLGALNGEEANARQLRNELQEQIDGLMRTTATAEKAQEGAHNELKEAQELAARWHDDCADELAEYHQKVGDLEFLRHTTGEGYVADCRVSEWRPGVCSQSCGAGNMTMTRVVVARETEGGLPCPELQKVEVCNTHPCPSDCVMSPWGEWSECTRPCGGGTRARTRVVEEPAAHGGLACSAVQDTQLCSVGACDTACTLSEWTPWSQCSQRCGGGIKQRLRPVAVEATGQGHCAPIDDPTRRESQPCTQWPEPCPDEFVCQGADLDLVVLVDRSGSLPEAEVEAELEAVRRLGRGFEIGQGPTRMAVLGFSENAEVLRPLSAEPLDLAGSGSLPRKGTNLANALAEAERMLAQANYKEARPMTVLVLTDGRTDTKLWSVAESAKVRQMGARVIMAVAGAVPGGPIATHAAKFVSWPSESSLVLAPDFASFLTRRDVLEMACPFNQVPVPAPVVQTQLVEGLLCRGDDCKSSATCPEGMGVIQCDSQLGGDGAHMEGTTCEAYTNTKAVATCATLTRTMRVASSSMYEDKRTLSAQCPDGTAALSCNCHSPWTIGVCGGQSTFEPDGQVCSKSIGRSGGRRRGTGVGAGAIVYAVCKEDAPYYALSLGEARCPAGHEITSEQECEQALQSLGRCHASKGVAAANLPPHCSHAPGSCGSGDWHFNSGAGSGRADASPICKSSR